MTRQTAWLVGVVAAVSPMAAAAQSPREAALEARLAELERAVGELRAELAAARTAPAGAGATGTAASTAPASTAGTGRNTATSSPANAQASAPTDGFTVAGTTIKVNGFIKANVIVSSFDGGALAGNSLGRDFYLPSTIPVGGIEESTRFDAHAKQTRLAISTATPVGTSTLKGLIEADFQVTPTAGSERTTNGFQPSLRRAFVNVDGFLPGQLLVGTEWSLFQNVGALPETTDFIGPTEGTVFVRQPQLRYTQPLGKGLSLAVSVENPETATITPLSPALVENDDDRVPDVVARIGYTAGFGEVSIAGIVRQLSVDEGVADGDATGWGVSAAGKLLFGPKKQHDLRFMITAGQGLGRYLGLNFAPDGIYVPVAGGGLETVDNLAGFAALRLAWTTQLRSTFMGSFQDTDYPDAITPFTANANAWSAAGNLFYTPLKGFDFGLEFRHGERELVDGRSGALDRGEFIAKYSF